MAILSPTGLETHPTGTGNPNELINNNWVLLNGLYSSAPFAPAGVINLIGGGVTALDGFNVTGWAVNSFVLTYATDNSPAATGKRFRVYFFRDMVGIEVENTPSLIVSDDEPTKVFELIG